MYIYFPEENLFLSGNLTLAEEAQTEFMFMNSNFLIHNNLFFNFENGRIYSDEGNILIRSNEIVYSEKEFSYCVLKNGQINSLKLNISSSFDIGEEILEKILYSFVTFISSFDSEFNNIQINREGELFNFTVWSPNFSLLKQWNISYENEEGFISANIKSVFSKDRMYQINNYENTDEILRAIRKINDYNTIFALHNRFPDPYFVDNKGNSALMICIIHDIDEIAFSLIHSSDLKHKNKNGEDAFLLALKNKKELLADEISKYNIDIDEKHLICALERNLKIASTIALTIKTPNPIILEISIAQENSFVTCEIVKNILLTKEEYFEYTSMSDEISSRNLYLSCMFGNSQKANYILDSIERKYIQDHCIIYAALHEMEDVCYKLLNKGLPVNVYLYGKNLEFYIRNEKLLLRVLEVKTNMIFSDDFRFFQLSDFTDVEKIGSGSFGESKKVILNSTQEVMIIKRSKRCSMNNLVEQDVIKEVHLLKKINDIYPEICPKLYGILFDGDCLCLVLEFCGINLSDYVFGLTVEERKEKFKGIFSSICNHVLKLSNLGIIHYDLHSDNILVLNETIKLIDVGMSRFYEIYAPISLLQNHVNVKTYWRPFDGLTNYEYGSTHFINYSFDVYSIGQLMCNYIYKQNSLRFVYTNGTLIAMNAKETFFAPLTYFEGYDEELKELIFKMIEIDSKQRFTARNVLASSYFNELPDSNYLSFPPISGVSNLTRKYLVENKYDMTQINNMLSFYKNDTIRVLKRLEPEYIEELKNYTTSNQINDNTYFNSIFGNLSYENSENVSIQSICACWTYIYSCIFELNSIRSNVSFNNFQIKFINDQLRFKQIKFYPVMLYFSYISLMLRENPNYIEIMNNLKETFVKFLMNVTFDFNIWNVICVIIKDVIVLDQVNEEEENEINNIINHRRYYTRR